MTAVDDKHRSNHAGSILLGLLAAGLALAAAYLWLSDEVPEPIRALLPPSPVERVAAPAPTTPAQPRPARVTRASAPPSVTPPPLSATIAPPPAPVRPPPSPAFAPDSQIANDAAAVGMTARVRPVDAAATPGR